MTPALYTLLLAAAAMLALLLALCATSEGQELEAFIQRIPETLLEFEMVPVPGCTYEIQNPENEGATEAVEIRPFWIGTTEVTWELYDSYMHGPPGEVVSDAQGDQGSAQPAASDGIARPSKPYGAPDHGWGHQGFAVLHVTYKAACTFCEWLSHYTGRTYRLPTEAEWEYACRAGVLPAGPIEDADLLDSLAWYWENGEDQTHKVATKEPNAWGVHDMLGNVGEWCTGLGRKPVLRGGSYTDRADAVHPAARQTQTDDWQMSDPQIPKSKWWLSDAPFAGFRVVCEP